MTDSAPLIILSALRRSCVVNALCPAEALGSFTYDGLFALDQPTRAELSQSGAPEPVELALARKLLTHPRPAESLEWAPGSYLIECLVVELGGSKEGRRLAAPLGARLVAPTLDPDQWAVSWRWRSSETALREIITPLAVQAEKALLERACAAPSRAKDRPSL